ncbi:DUF4214 domain-containing protein [Halomonas sp. Bachu 37]|uniref:DUF4214 domain-containing protein n=1 Tax=Halomonas kashgarensis TaxID=3084920 RepID=UPI0032165FD0
METQDLVQQLYLAYYGRPADPGGLAYWSEQLDANDGDLDSAINFFGDSDEFTQRYGDEEPTDLVNNMYQQLFGRDAEEEGLEFYTEKLESGEVSLAQIAGIISQNAANEDETTVQNRVSVANDFTREVEERGLEYGPDEIEAASQLVANVNADTDVDAYVQGDVEATLETLPAADDEEPGNGDDETPGDGDEAPTPTEPTFEAVEDAEGNVTFDGTATGNITFTTDSEDNATFSREGVAATNTVAITQDTEINLAEGQTLELTAEQADLFGNGQITGDGDVVLNEVTFSELEGALAKFGTSGDVSYTLDDTEGDIAVTDADDAVLVAGAENAGDYTIDFDGDTEGGDAELTAEQFTTITDADVGLSDDDAITVTGVTADDFDDVYGALQDDDTIEVAADEEVELSADELASDTDATLTAAEGESADLLVAGVADDDTLTATDLVDTFDVSGLENGQSATIEGFEVGDGLDTGIVGMETGVLDDGAESGFQASVNDIDSDGDGSDDSAEVIYELTEDGSQTATVTLTGITTGDADFEANGGIITAVPSDNVA